MCQRVLQTIEPMGMGILISDVHRQVFTDNRLTLMSRTEVPVVTMLRTASRRLSARQLSSKASIAWAAQCTVLDAHASYTSALYESFLGAIVSAVESFADAFHENA